MALEIVGTLIKKIQVQSGVSSRGPWSKQDFVVETQETFPKKVCMNVWGVDKVAELESFNDGEVLKVSFNVESREYNERWYTDIRAWKIERMGDGASAAPSNFSSPAAPATPENSFTDKDADDLPF